MIKTLSNFLLSIKLSLNKKDVIPFLFMFIYILSVTLWIISFICDIHLIILSKELEDVLDSMNHAKEVCEINNTKLIDNKENITDIFTQFLNIFNPNNNYQGNFYLSSEFKFPFVTVHEKSNIISIPDYYQKVKLMIQYEKSLEVVYEICDIINEYKLIQKDLLLKM
uniref:Uncharacterized protein n=1 Tax=Clonostachys rogersoniana TaxID=122658 RepID=A0A8F1Y2H7_CLORO|nr:hypothetical protein [Clonostachys rogersoniana]